MGEDGAGEIGGGVVLRQPMRKPAVFDGQSSWEAYYTQFELLSDLNHWSVDQKSSYLAVSLRGSALPVLTNLLQNRFGTGQQTELNRANL